MSVGPNAQPVSIAPEAGLTVSKILELRAQLQAKLETLSHEDHELRQRLASAETATEHAVLDGAEQALSVESNLEVIHQIQHERKELGAVQSALDRIDSGEYGMCTRCDAPVGHARLEALPEAALCIRCQEAEERGTFHTH